MTHDDLKLIIDAIGSTSGDAKTVLITWFSMDIGKVLLHWVGGLTLAFILTRHILRTVAACYQSEDWLRQIRDVVIPGQTGTHVSGQEFRRILSTLKS